MPSGGIPKLTKDELYQLYVVEKKTDAEIAEIAGYKAGKYSVYVARKRYGIKKIPRWQRHECNPTQRQLDIIYGTLMGDGCIENRNVQRNSECCLGIKHALSQTDYVDWKFEELNNLCLSPPKEVSERYRFRTFAHPFFSKLRSEFYPRGIKRVSHKVLEKLSGLSIAVWFMDDGTNLDQGTTLRFATCSFSESDHKRMMAFFDKQLNIQTVTSVYSGYRVLRIHKDCRKRFIDLIHDHVPDCMKYKVKLHA